MRLRHVFGPGLAVVVLGACGDSSGPNGVGHVRVLLTDAPSDYIATAEVHISHVYLQGGVDDDAAKFDLFNDPDNPKVFDLLLLQDGLTADLTGVVEVESGDYAQLRLVVDHAVVTLAEGYAFNDGSTEMTLFVPSGMQTGIKVQLNAPIEAEEGETTTVIVDFDVDQNFVLQGNPETPGGLNGILFTPVLHELSRETQPTL